MTSAGGTGGRSGDRVLLWAHRLAGAESRTGIGRYIVQLTRALAARPWDHGLRYELCCGPEREPADWVPPGVAVRRLGPNRRALHAAWTIAHRPAVDRLAGPAAVVHALHPPVPVPTRCPLVVTVHDLFPFDHPGWFPLTRRLAFRRAIGWAADHAAHLVADSGHTKDRLVASLGVEAERVSVVWPGISPRFHQPVDETERSAVLARHGLAEGTYAIAVGAMTERENLGSVVTALRQLPPEVTLVAVGPWRGGHRDVLAAAEQAGVGDRVRLTGFVSDEDLVALLSGALVLVQPALDEGFGLVPLEAMALGTPAAVSDSGSLPEVTGGAALVVASSDPAAWAAAIAELREDPDRRAALVAAGRRHTAGLTWEAAAEQVAAVHQRVARVGS